jgi:hypothetical protein
MPANATCVLRLVRRSGYVDAFRLYKIFVNGTQVSTIARNSTVELELPSGPLTIEARVDWGRSKPLTIVAAPNEKIEVEVANHWGALLAIWAITFGSGSYLKLTRIPAAAAGA